MQVFTKSTEAHSKTSSSKTAHFESSVSSPFFQPKPVPNTEDGVQRQAAEPSGAQGLPAIHRNGNVYQHGTVQRLCTECRQDAEPEEVQRQAAPLSLTLQRAEEEPEEIKRQEIGPEEEVQRQEANPQSQTVSNSPAEAPGTKPAISPEAPMVSLAQAVPVSVTAPSPVIQPSLKVGVPDSPLEREADEMAERVQRMPQKQWAAAAVQVAPPAVQRQEEEEEVQAKFAQRAPELQRSADGGLSTTPQFSSRLKSSGAGAPLPPASRKHMEGAFGANFSTVRIHTGTEAAQLSSGIGAHAFTHKNHIYFNAGAYNPSTPGGQFLLAHELTHTLQQGAAVQRAGEGTSLRNGRAEPNTTDTGLAPSPQLPQAETMPPEEPASREPTPLPENVAPLPALQPEEPPESIAGEEAPETEMPEETVGQDVSVAVPAGPEASASGGSPLLSPEPLMPEPPSELGPEARQRLGQAQSNAGRNASSSRSLPSAAENTAEARGAVTEPDEETRARASGELTAQLNERPEPSPEIEELCERIRQVIRSKRPPDEDSLLEADPEEAAGEAGTQLNNNISSDVDRVGGEYDSMDSPPAGERQQEGQDPNVPPNAFGGPDIDATQAAPDPVPAEDVSLDNDVENTSSSLEQAGMSTEVADAIQDPNNPVVQARETQGELEETAAQAPAEVLAQQDVAIAGAQADMQALQAQALEALQRSRSESISGAGQQQVTMAGSEEQQRAAIGQRAEEIFNQAQTDVNNLLQPLTRTAMEMWETGKARLATEFRQHLDEVQSWVDERHSGVGGLITGAYDYFAGLPDWVTREYDSAERRFGDGVCDKIREISTYVNSVILACEQIIDNADQEIATLFENAREELGDWAVQEQERFANRLTGLRNQVHETQENFNRDLANRAAESVQEVRQEIHSLREAAKGLIGKIADAIQQFLDDPIRFIINGLLTLVGIEPARFWALAARIQQVIADIADDPLGFAGNLLSAIGQGFEQFFDNFGTHLLEGLIEWLFSGLGAMGIQIPREFSLSSIITFFLQLMGFTWERIRRLLARHIGEQNVAIIEQAYQLLSTLIEMGPEGIFEMIKDMLNPQNILDMILEAAVEFLVEAIVRQVSVRLLLMFNPVGAIAQAIEAIYKVLKWIFENAARIFTLIETVVNGMADIVAGNIGGMANAVEQALKRLLVPVIDFIAELFSLGALPERVADVVRGMQDWIEGILDRAIGFLANQARNLVQALGFGRNNEEEQVNENLEEGDGEVGKIVPFYNNQHRVFINVQGTDAEVYMSSVRMPVVARLSEWQQGIETLRDEDEKNRVKSLISTARTKITETERFALSTLNEMNDPEPDENQINSVDNQTEQSEESLSSILTEIYEIFDNAQGEGGRIALYTVFFGQPGVSFDRAEYYSQLKGQERGINALKVSEWSSNRARYLEEGRAESGSRAQQEYRQRVAVTLRELKQDEGMSVEESIVWVEEYMSTQAALHDPDQVAGGDPEGIADGDFSSITGLGNLRINSSIGSKWAKLGRIQGLDEHVRDETRDMSESQKENMLMNVRLEF
ncbi:MAG: DUF4157 domain-containing protein [Phaeodactylibacter sp.]|nr:DUF4157 domain-containing protein [Phaeodactylibacter sp.]